MSQVADDLADIRAFNARRGPRCSVAILMESLEPTISDKLTRALDDPTCQTKAIARWLGGQGFDLSHWQLQYHRRGDCACG
jgi:hypothetical protein